MLDAQEIIDDLDMSDANIANAIGCSKLAIMNIRLGRSDGSRLLSKLQGLHKIQNGHTNIQTSVQEIATTHQREPDIAPSYDYRYEDEDEHIFKKIQKKASKVFHYNREQERELIVDSTPKRTPATRKSSPVFIEDEYEDEYENGYETQQNMPYSLEDLQRTSLGGIYFIASALFNKNSLPGAHLSLPAPAQSSQNLPTQVSTRFVPTQQFRKTGNDTTRTLQLSMPKNGARVSSLGYSAQPDRVETPYYGDLYNRMKR